jgi:predicted permease
MTTGSAVARAREEFGDIEFTRQYCREIDQRTERGIRMTDRLAAWRQDASYAWRTLRRSPGFALISILTLALAIGANTAIFSVARAVLLRPLPYGDPGALVGFFTVPSQNPDSRYDLSGPDLVDYRTRQHSLTAIAGWSYRMATTWRPRSGDPQIVNAMPVTANMFDVLQVKALRGRTLIEGDDAPGARSTVVLGYRFWQRELGGDPAVIGTSLVLYDEPHEIVGIMPGGFALRGREDMWVPLDVTTELANPTVTRKQHVFGGIARLKPGVTLEAGRSDVLAVSRQLQSEYPEADGQYQATLEPLHQRMAAGLQRPVLLLLAAAMAVLLIACANLANLTLSRTIGRRTEIAVRAALGAGRARIARQLLTESVLLALIGGLVGVAIAEVATRAILALNPETLPPLFSVGTDGPVLGFCLLLSLATGVLFGLLPALDAGKADLQTSLRSQGRGGTARGSERARRGLVVAQVGLAVVLLVGAGLLIRSFRDLTRVDLGFDPDHVLTAQLRIDGPKYDSAEAVNRFYDGVIEEVANTPGVEAVGATMHVPMQGGENSSIYVEGSTMDPEHPPGIAYTMVRGEYFKTMRIPIVKGRGFDASDVPGGAPTGLINQAAERAFFPGGDAVGRRIRIGPNSKAALVTIIGVVADIRDQSLDTPATPSYYDNARRNTWWGSLSLVVRTTANPESAIPAVRLAVKNADPALAVRGFEPMVDVIGTSLAARRFALALATAFAALALTLAAVGIYGVLAYSVTARTREFGVRLALGASPRSVLTLVLREGLGWSLLGLGLGVTAALAGGRLLAGMLYGVTSGDAVTYLIVASGLVVVVVVACAVPALRATRVDPLTSIRAE